MKTLPFLLHALSPLHAGTGHAADVIDLPTARMKATGIPFVPGSSRRTQLIPHPLSSPIPHLSSLITPRLASRAAV